MDNSSVAIREWKAAPSACKPQFARFVSAVSNHTETTRLTRNTQTGSFVANVTIACARTSSESTKGTVMPAAITDSSLQAIRSTSD
jgi:hypothetical protein